MELELSNENVKYELSKYLQTYGVKQNHISKKTGLSNPTICLFLKGQRELLPSKLEIIYSIISERQGNII